MAHHDDVDRERILFVEIARFVDLLQPRLEKGLVDIGRTAIDQDQMRILLRSEVQHQAIALARPQYIQTEEHFPPP